MGQLQLFGVLINKSPWQFGSVVSAVCLLDMIFAFGIQVSGTSLAVE